MGRRRLALLSVVVAAVVVSAAAAGISPSDNGPDYANAIAGQPGLVTGGSFVTRPPVGTPNAISDTPLAGFPTNGSSYAILSTGNAMIADQPNTSAESGTNDGGSAVRGGAELDVSILKIDFTVPANNNCLSFDFKFLTEEYPEFVGQEFNDAFIAELDNSNWTSSGTTINAPNNFAFDPSHQPITVNATGATTVSPANSAGTTYDGATPTLAAVTPVTPGPHSLYLSIFDQGDNDLDSAAFVDNLVTGATQAGGCVKGATTGGGVGGGGGGGGQGGTPKAGKITGTVKIKAPGSNTFIEIKPGDPIPNGSIIDTTHGTIVIPSATGGSDVFYGGVFALFMTTEASPTNAKAAKPLIEIRLAKSNFTICKSKSLRRLQDASTTPPKKPVNTLWGHGNGHFKTKAKYGSATVRGTFWLTQDRCDGSYFFVKQGKVDVRDFFKKKTIHLTAGKSYLATGHK